MANFNYRKLIQLLLPGLKIYGCLSVIHVLYKLLALYSRITRAKKLWKHLPGKDSDPLARRMSSKGVDFHDFFAELAWEHPEAAVVKLDADVPTLMVCSPEALKWMLKDEFSNITKTGGDGYFFELLGEFLGKKGIFLLQHGKSNPAQDVLWTKERKVSSLIFTKSNFQSIFFDTFLEKAEKMKGVLGNYAGTKEKLNLQELFFSFTMDSIEKFFMGSEVNTIEGGMSDYGKNFDRAHQALMRILTDSIMLQASVRLILPFPFGNLEPYSSTRSSIMMRLRKMTNGDEKEFARAVKNLRKHIIEYIKETRADVNLTQRKDIIANFLNSGFGEELDDDLLTDIVLSLTIAGRDTTACALSWMFFELTQNLSVQEQLITEIDTKLEDRVPKMNELEAENMPYLNGIIYETLRMHPPVPTNQKTVMKDVTYLDGTLIPEGTKLVYSPYAIGRNPSRFKNPLKFDPNRWIPFVQPSLYEFPVFQAGPRFCLGKDMAVLEMKLLTIRLLQTFRFTLLPGEEKKIGYSLMATQSIANDACRKSLELWCYAHERK